jgi:hypothetical protein
VHEVGEKAPCSEADQVTVPTGELPDTVAVQVKADPTAAECEEHDTAVEEAGPASTETSSSP